MINRKLKYLFYIFMVLAFLTAVFFIFATKKINLNNNEISAIFNRKEKIERPEKLKNPPSPIRGIYMTSWVAGTPSLFNGLVELVDQTELNAVVLDVKDYSGYLTFKTDISLAEEIGAHNEIRVQNIDSVIKQLHEKNIYVIGRLQVFQDSVFALARPDLAIKDVYTNQPWQDHKGLSWLDPAGQEVWQYVLAIAREADQRGFDEINFDYIRFPSDGNLERMSFPFWDGLIPRYDIIRSFFEFLRTETAKDDIKISADIFGMAAYQAMDFDYDLNIGQRMIDILPYFDAVLPMVYPSHYSAQTAGYKNPAEHPYEIVHTSLARLQELVATTSFSAKIRPWLQDFDIGADYGTAEIKAQIQAVYDNGIEEWFLWNASNRYTSEALLKE